MLATCITCALFLYLCVLGFHYQSPFFTAASYTTAEVPILSIAHTPIYVEAMTALPCLTVEHHTHRLSFLIKQVCCLTLF